MNKYWKFSIVIILLFCFLFFILKEKINSRSDDRNFKFSVVPFQSYSLEDSSETQFSLCWVENEEIANRTSFAKRFYYTDYENDNGKIYVSDLPNDTPMLWKDLNQNYSDSIFLQSCVVAISPKYGTVFAAPFDIFPGAGVWICEEEKRTLLNYEDPLQGWLYNCGIDFVYDDAGNEFCLFAEYSHARKNTRRVLKGCYPYTNPDNWKVVLEYPSGRGDGEAIFHFHHIQKDPYSPYIYLTSGDNAEESKFFYSNDLGETWQLLISHQSTGFLRCCNLIFLEDKIYWASDDNRGHFLMSARRMPTGLLDTTAIERVADLPEYQATNALAYLEYANVLFFYDRLPSASLCNKNNWEFRDVLKVYLYDLQESKIVPLAKMNFLELPYNDAFGHRGRAYLHYSNSVDYYPILGFCRNYAPCNFNLPENQEFQLGSLGYRIEF